MVAMAVPALGPVMLIERVLMFAAVKQTGICRVAETATTADLGDTRRTSSVVAMTSVARRCTKVTANKQCTSMHAVAIFGELRRWKRRPIRACESGHDFRIGMTRAARFRHTLRVHFGLR